MTAILLINNQLRKNMNTAYHLNKKSQNTDFQRYFKNVRTEVCNKS